LQIQIYLSAFSGYERGNVDGLPTVLLEAMASGAAVVASAIGGVPLVIEHGTNGLLVEPGNETQLLESISCLLKSPDERVRLASNARTAVEERLNWTAVAEKFERLYRISTPVE
jgi:glycosyltransferase involved in cell wall biosynthesis